MLDAISEVSNALSLCENKCARIVDKLENKDCVQ